MFVFVMQPMRKNIISDFNNYILRNRHNKYAMTICQVKYRTLTEQHVNICIPLHKNTVYSGIAKDALQMLSKILRNRKKFDRTKKKCYTAMPYLFLSAWQWMLDNLFPDEEKTFDNRGVFLQKYAENTVHMICKQR